LQLHLVAVLQGLHVAVNLQRCQGCIGVQRHAVALRVQAGFVAAQGCTVLTCLERCVAELALALSELPLLHHPAARGVAWRGVTGEGGARVLRCRRLLRAGVSSLAKPSPAAPNQPLVPAVDVALHSRELGAGGREAVEELVLLVARAPQVPLRVVGGKLLAPRLLARHVAAVQLARLQLALPAGLEFLELAAKLFVACRLRGGRILLLLVRRRWRGCVGCCCCCWW
jgi:hypothetical protein